MQVYDANPNTLNHVIMVINHGNEEETMENPNLLTLIVYISYLPFPTLCTMWICLAMVLCTKSGKPEPDPELWIWKSDKIT